MGPGAAEGAYISQLRRVRLTCKRWDYDGSRGRLGRAIRHVSKMYHASLKARDPDNVAVFIQEFDEYEKNIDSPSPDKRLPNYIVMSLPEDHTRGTQPGAFTPVAMVASNDSAVGRLVAESHTANTGPRLPSS